MKKELLLFGIVILLVCVGLSGCQNNTTKKSGSTDTDGDGWSDETELHYGTDPNNASSYPEDTDHDGIPDSVDPDDDNDGLSDVIEIQLGSNPKNESDVTKISINGTEYYLVDTNGDGESDILYNSIYETFTQIYVTEENKYEIDTDGDGVWDYIYDPLTGIINEIKNPEIETITVSGTDVVQTINKPGKLIILDVSGVNNDITVTNETNLTQVVLSGVNCVVRVSRSHSFTSDVSGVNSEIVYYD